MKHTKLVLALAAAGVLVVGCGGSSSSSTAGGGTTTTSLTGSTKFGAVPTAAIKITPTTATGVVQGSSTSLGSMKGSSKAISVKALVADNSISAIVQREVLSIQGTKFKALPVGVMGTPSTNVPCVAAGTYTTSYTLQNAGAITKGDNYAISYAGCDDGGGTVQTGALTMVFNTSMTSATTDFSVSVKFTDLQSVSVADTTIIDGDISMSKIGATTTLWGKLLAMSSTVDGIFQMADFNMSSGTSTNVTMTIAGTGMNGSVTMTTPTASSVRFTGASGTYVELTDNAANPNIDCDMTVFDGSNTTKTTQTWASLGF